MNPLGTRSRVEELARLLDGAVAGPGALTAGHAGLAARLRTLAPALEATPRPEFRAALRQRLVAVATVQAASPAVVVEPSRVKALDAAVSWSQSRRGQRRATVLAGAMAGVVAVTGVAVASSRSVPGAPFYGLKRGAEGAQLALTRGDLAKGSLHLEFAATRLREVQALAEGDNEVSLGSGTQPLAAGTALGRSLQAKLSDTLADFDDEAQDGTRLLQQSYREGGKQEPLRILTRFAAQQESRLKAVLPTLPAATRQAAESSLALVTTIGDEATEQLALGLCGGSCFPGNGGPALPSAPAPQPGATAVPTGTVSPDDSDDNGVPDCQCSGSPVQTPSPEPAPSPSASEDPDVVTPPQPTEEPTPTPTPTASPSSNPLPIPLPSLPVPLPTLPVPLPSLPALPLPLPTLPPLPSLLPLPQLPLGDSTS